MQISNVINDHVNPSDWLAKGVNQMFHTSQSRVLRQQSTAVARRCRRHPAPARQSRNINRPFCMKGDFFLQVFDCLSVSLINAAGRCLFPMLIYTRHWLLMIFLCSWHILPSVLLNIIVYGELRAASVFCLPVAATSSRGGRPCYLMCDSRAS